MSAVSPSLRGKLGASVAHQRHNGSDITANSRKAQWERWLNVVDPDRMLPERERVKRARNARREYMLRLAIKSLEVRRERQKSN